MKTRTHDLLNKTAALLVAIALLLGLSGSSAWAASGTWNVDAAGNWDTATTANWSGGTVASGAGFTANFSLDITANRTVTLNENLSIAHLFFNDTGAASDKVWTLARSGANVLTLDNSGSGSTIQNDTDVGFSSGAIISAVLAGSENVTIKNSTAATPTRIIQLQGANTFTGTITIESGFLSAGANNITSGANGPLGNSTTAIILGNASTIAASSDAPNHGLDVKGNVTTEQNFSINRNIDSSAIANVTGRTDVRYMNDSASGLGTLTVSGNWTLGNTTTRSYGLVAKLAGMKVDFTGQITGGNSAKAFRINDNNNGVGTNRLSNAGNTYAGATAVCAGTLLIAGDAAAGSGVLGANSSLQLNENADSAALIDGAFTVGKTITLQSAGAIYTLGGNQAAVSSFTGNINSSSTATSHTLKLSQVAGGTVTFSGIIGANANATGTTSVEKIDAGTVILTGANTYDGTTTVTAGTLLLGQGGSIPASTTTVSSTATLGSAAVTTTAIGGAVTYNSGALGYFTGSGGLSSAVGKITVAGNLSLSGNNITVNVAGAPLANGTYRLLECTGSGVLSGTIGTLTMTGTALPSGAGGSLSITTGTGTAGHVDLVVSGGTSATTTSPSSTSVCASSTASFSVTGGGSTPLSYAWRKRGSGWGQSWNITDTPGSGFAGHLIGTPSGSDIGSSCWQIYANGSGSPQSVAYRNFPTALQPLAAGQSFVIDLQNPGNAGAVGKIGFGLTDSSGTEYFAFQSVANGSWTIHDNASATTATGVTKDARGVRVTVTLTSASTYSCTIQKYNSGGGSFSSTTTVTGTFVSNAANGISRLYLWNINDGSNSDVYFNNIVIGPGADDNGGNYGGIWTSGAADTFGQKPLANGATGNGSTISGATTANLQIAATATADAGNYDCLVYNSIGYATSSSATLTVNTQSTISSNPASQTRAVGNNLTFTVATTGGSPSPTFQWRKNGATISNGATGNGSTYSGATTTTLTISGVQTGDAASAAGYDCVVVNGSCSQNSSAATLVVNVAPTISGGGQPANATACSGNSVSFTNTPTTGTGLSYQWRKRTNGWSSSGWSITTPNSPGGSGVFVGNSTNNNSGPTDSNMDGDVNTGNRAWALYANSANTAEAARVSSNSLAVGQTVKIDLDNGTVASGASAGFTLKAGSNVRFEFIADGTSQTYKLTDNGGVAAVATSVPLTREGVRVTFTLTAANTYSLSFTTLVDGVVRGPFTGTLASSGSLDTIRVYNFNAGSGSGADFFFNNLAFGDNSDNASDTAYNGGLATGNNGGGLNLSNGGNYAITTGASSVLTINNTTAGDVGSYDVVVSAGGAPSVTSSSATLTVNPSPTANADSFTRLIGQMYKIAKASLVTNDTGSGLTFTSFTSPTTQGFTLLSDTDYIYYTNTATGSADTFNYTVSNGSGCSSSATVTINVATSITGPVSISNAPSGPVTITFGGIPGTNYVIQTNYVGIASPSSWGDALSTNCPVGGIFSYVDNFGGGSPPSQAYYRLKYVVP